MWTKLFWKDTIERAVSTMAQVLISLFAVDQFNLLTLDWVATLATVGAAGLLAVAKALAATQFVKESVSPASFAPDGKEI